MTPLTETNGHANGNHGNHDKVLTHDNSLKVPEANANKTSTPLHSVSTKSYAHDNEFIKPEREYEISFPWRRIGSFIDPDTITNEEVDELPFPKFSESTHRLSTYIYEKYYADLYWNCSLIVGCCFYSWLISYIGFGFFSFIFVTICTFAVYRAEFRRFNTNIRDDMQRINSIETLESRFESIEWFNNFISKFWVIYMPVLSELVITNTNEVLKDVQPPPPIDKLSLDEFTLGTKAPKIDSIKSFTKLGNDVYQMDWKFNFTPNDTDDMTKKQIKSKIDPKVALGIRIGKGFIGASLPVLVENMSIIGNLRIKIKLGNNFPNIDVISICFLEPPIIDYALKPVGGNTLGLDVMSVIPGLSSFVKSLINSNLAPMMYYPNTIDINLSEILKPPTSIGCLFVKVRGVEFNSTEKINPYVKYNVENQLDTTYQTDIKYNTTTPVFNESNKILLTNLTSRLQFELFNLLVDGDSKFLGEAFIELQDLLQSSKMELKETKLIKNNKNIGKIVFDLEWLPVLKPDTLPDGSLGPAPDSNVGILDFNLLSMTNLDSEKSLIDRLTTFTEFYIDDKLIKKTRVVKGTNHPEYNFQFDELIYNKNLSTFKMLVKDISSFKETTIAEYSANLLDLLLIDSKEKEIVLKFTDGLGEFKFSKNWKPLSSIPSDEDKDTISFVPPLGVFKINVTSCKGLHDMKGTLHTIDPYVTITTGGFDNIHGITSVVKDTTDPEFDESFYVSILSKNQKIQLNVLNHSKNNKKDLLMGSTFITLGNFDFNAVNETINFKNVNLYKTGKHVGSITYSLTFYALMNLYSHEELLRIQEEKEEKEGEDSASVNEEDEEQAKFLEDYKKHPNAYEWVDDEKTLTSLDADKITMPLDELLHYNSGVLGINIIKGSLQFKNCYIQIFIDDRSYPDFTSRKVSNFKINSNSGDCFIRDLKNSILNIKIVRIQKPKFQSDVLYETKESFQVYDLLKRGFDNSIDLKLGDSTITFNFEFIPVDNKENRELSIDSVNETGILDLKIMSCSNLMSADRNGVSDPFVLGYLNDTKIFKTKIVKKTLNPEFNENYVLKIKSIKHSKLLLSIYDWDRAGSNDFLGNVFVDLSKFEVDKPSVIDLPLDTEGTIKLGYLFKPGYIKASSTLLSEEEEEYMRFGLVGDAAGLATGVAGAVGGVALDAAGGAIGLAGGVALDAAGGAIGLAGGAVGTAGGAIGLAGGAVGTAGGVATGVASKVGGGFGKLIRHDDEANHNHNGSESSHLLKPPSFLKHKHTASKQSSEISRSSVDFNNGNQMRVPSSPGVINNGNYKTRTSMDAASVKTGSFNGVGAHSGRLRILAVENFDSAHGDHLAVKVNLKSSNGTEKNIYKTRSHKLNDGHIEFKEDLVFKCDMNSSIVFSLQHLHKFSKNEDLAQGQVVVGSIAGVQDDVKVELRGQINCDLIVNFNY